MSIIIDGQSLRNHIQYLRRQTFLLNKKIENLSPASGGGSGGIMPAPSSQGANISIANLPVKDEDNMASNSDVHLVTQQSVKQFALPLAGGVMTGSLTVGVDDTGHDVKFFGATSGAYLLWDESADKLLIAGGATIDIVKDKLLIGGTAVTTTAAELNVLDGYTGSVTELNYLDTLHATGVTDTEFDYLDGVTSNIQTQLDAKLPLSGGAMTGAITTNSTFDGRDVSADGDKLDGIEANATADQTNAEIRAAVEAASDSNVFTDADHSKLNGIAASANNYVHPTHDGDDIDIDTTALTGATVISDLDFNITTDTLGHVTDANGTVATRNLTLGNLGYTGDTDANKYVLPIATASALGGIKVGSNLTIDSVTGVLNVGAIALTTVQAAADQTAHLNLTAQEGDIVVRSDENKSYVHNGGTAGTMADYTLLLTPTDAVLSVTTTDGTYINLTPNSATTGAINVAADLSAVDGTADTNTKFLSKDNTWDVPAYTTETYTAHENISAASSVDNSGRTYIQDITLDSNGHVTGLASATETVTNTNQLTTFTIRDDDDDAKVIAQDKFIKFVAATGTLGTNWSGTGVTGDPWVMTITSPNDNTFRTVKVDTNGDGSANNTLTATEDLMLKKGSNITLAEADGVVTISSTATGTVDGSGTANDVVMWSDSDTLTDAPIAISGNDAAFAGNVDIYTGGSTATLNIGRNSSERLQAHITDTNITLTATNDVDENQQHDFILDRSFGGSGGNNFRIKKGGADQFTIDANGNTKLWTGGLQVIDGFVEFGHSDTSNYITIKSGGANDQASDVGIQFYYSGPGGDHPGSIKMIEQGNDSPDGRFKFSLPKDSGNGTNSTETQVLEINQDGDATFAGTITAAGGAANNNDTANILTLNASQHARLLVDTSSTSGHRATLVLESNGNELTLSNTGSTSYLTAVGQLDITTTLADFSGGIDVSEQITAGNAIETAKQLVAKGQNTDHTASTIKISQENTTKSQIRCYGADATTAGTFELLLSASDGTPNYTALAFDNSANATFAGNIQVGGFDDGSNYSATIGWNAVDSEAVGTKRSNLTFQTTQTAVNNEDIYKWSIAMIAAPATVSGEEFGSDLAFLRSTRSNTYTDEPSLTLGRTGDATFAGTISSKEISIKQQDDSGFDAGLTIERSANTQKVHIGMDGGAVNFNSPDGLSYKFRNNGTEKFTVDGSGNATFSGSITSEQGASAVRLGEYNNGAVIWMDGSNGDFTGGDYFGIHAYGTDTLAFGYAGSTKMTMDNEGKLGLNGTTPNDYHDDADDLIVGSGTGNTGMTIRSGTSGYGSIFFADGTADDATEKRGQIRYLQGTERMDFHTDNVATAALSLAANGNATFASDIALGGGSILTTHSGQESSIFLDNQSSIFTRNDSSVGSLFLTQNFYYGSDGNGKAIEAGYSNVLVLNREELNLYFSAASVSADATTSLQEKFKVTKDGNATFAGSVTAPSATINGALTVTTSASGGKIQLNNASYDDWQIDIDSNGLVFYNSTDSRYDLKISGTGNAIFAGTITSGNIIATGSGNTDISSVSTGDWASLTVESSDAASAYIFLKDTSGERARLQSTANNDLKFLTNGGGSLALTLDSSTNATFEGNIEANVASNGGITIDSADIGTLKFLGSGSVHNWGLVSTKAAAGDFGLYKSDSAGGDPNTAGTAQLYFTNDGNATFAGKVGVGVSPTTLLHLNGTGDAIRVESTNAGSGGAQMDLLHFTASPADEDTHGVINMGGYYTGTTSVYGSQIKSIWTDVSERHSRLEFLTCDTTVSTALTLDHAANVGIPSTAANVKLNVISTDANWATIIKNYTTSGYGLSVDCSGAASTNYVLAAYSPSGTGMFLNGSGNFGLGTSSPSSKLHVSGTNTVGRFTSSSSYVDLIFENSSGTGGFLNFNSTTSFNVYVGGGSGSDHKLSLTNAGLLTVTGDIVAYGSPSDISLKENIKPIDNALDKVSKLKGVTFDWKKSDSILKIKEDIGFIAQDVKEVLPDLVRTNDDGKLSLRDKGIIPVLVEAIKELEARVKELENK